MGRIAGAGCLPPRVRVHDPRRLLLLVPVATLVLVPATTAVLILVAIAFLLGLPLAGILLFPVDPRPAIASAVLWADLGAAHTLGHTRLGLITLPVVVLAVLITIGREKALARQTHA
jgi:hypothetical protein